MIRVKTLYKVFMCFLIFTLTIPLMNFTAHAAPEGSYIEFQSDGSLVVEVTSTAATSGIRYRTAGWMITAVPTCSGGDCRPLNYTHVIFDNSSDAEESRWPNPPVPGQPVTTRWHFPAETVTSEFFRVFERLNPLIMDTAPLIKT